MKEGRHAYMQEGWMNCMKDERTILNEGGKKEGLHEGWPYCDGRNGSMKEGFCTVRSFYMKEGMLI